ncbi:putative DNA-binding transcriptional regulator YafY [Kribbella sp. VKM Ac-2527]|uniref:Putative DNA-binding transcriptional regulator YafY n=2 Tax=Kribbella caucasensis TaxID=2512215 RepID=A0A4V3CAJ0_9ACTN|nr:putative DNA-binding transcriptional regulator YafY [Kribbella sp. VKM Ac-2527]
MIMEESSPTARALLALELIQNQPGISGERLADRLGVSDRAARRYVGILRETGIPIESTPGRYGGYRIGRGFRLPPLMFSTAEALGLMMAALEGNRRAADAGDPAGSALDKILRVLPAPVAKPAEAIRQMIPARTGAGATNPDPEITAALVQSSAAHQRLRILYGTGEGYPMEVDPWAVSVRHGRWYLLCWSHTKDARRVLRVDRVSRVDTLPDTFEPPAGLDPFRAIEEHLAEGWKYQVEVVVEASVKAVAQWVPRNLGRLEEIDDEHTRLIGSTDEPDWYAQRLTLIEAPFHILSPTELCEAAQALGDRLVRASANPRP